ncbi:hypothetical protein M5K25_003805 [Dendrobium thyrsiflorum]|uniref:Uncharacterized protein n=1 Tax=Dendrobium thyrsiflorum TaxID=117978 RepID=A0ABD0VK72_DENTH
MWFSAITGRVIKDMEVVLYHHREGKNGRGSGSLPSLGSRGEGEGDEEEEGEACEEAVASLAPALGPNQNYYQEMSTFMESLVEVQSHRTRFSAITGRVRKDVEVVLCHHREGEKGRGSGYLLSPGRSFLGEIQTVVGDIPLVRILSSEDNKLWDGDSRRYSVAPHFKSSRRCGGKLGFLLRLMLSRNDVPSPKCPKWICRMRRWTLGLLSIRRKSMILLLQSSRLMSAVNMAIRQQHSLVRARLHFRANKSIMES